MTEKDLQNKIIKKLKSLEFSGKVLWWIRIPSFQIGNVRSGRAGLPDLLLILRNNITGHAVVFIELKKPSDKELKIKDLPIEQEAFFVQMACKGIRCEIINSYDQFIDLISKF